MTVNINILNDTKSTSMRTQCKCQLEIVYKIQSSVICDFMSLDERRCRHRQQKLFQIF